MKGQNKQQENCVDAWLLSVRECRDKKSRKVAEAMNNLGGVYRLRIRRVQYGAGYDGGGQYDRWQNHNV